MLEWHTVYNLFPRDCSNSNASENNIALKYIRM